MMASRSASRLLAKFSEARPLHNQLRCYASKSSSSDRPLYPSVEVLLHTNNLSASDIKATGPQGRLLKGDVLAHIGKINKETPAKLSSRYDQLSHLDLSNITPAAPKERTTKESPAAIDTEADVLDDVEELSLGIDLQPLLKLQKRLQDTLGQTLELSELISRAVDLANRNLPAAARVPTTDELFDEILYGASPAARIEDGEFIPAINNAAPAPKSSISGSRDLFDELVSADVARPSPVLQVRPFAASKATQGAVNEFSILTSSQERQRATIFLQRMKSVLEIEPGRLVL